MMVISFVLGRGDILIEEINYTGKSLQFGIQPVSGFMVRAEGHLQDHNVT